MFGLSLPRRIGLTLLGSGLLLALTACAAFHPPLSTTPPSSDLPSTSPKELPPPALSASLIDGAIHLSWQGDHTLQIFRRDLLASTPYKLLATVDPAAGHFLIDSSITPGSVYVYRARFLNLSSDHLPPGAFSEELYFLADTPETDHFEPEPDPRGDETSNSESPDPLP